LLAYAFPLIYSLYAKADFTVLANESLAYRYFAIDRLNAGENGNIWLPQGQFTTALQRGAMWALDAVEQVRPLTLRQRLNGFAYLALFFNLLLVAILLALTAWNRSLDWGNRALIATVLLVPIYCAHTNGLSYHLLPDYLAVSIVLLAYSLFVIVADDGSGRAQRPEREGLVVGALTGLLLANKVTLAPPAFLLIVSTMFRAGWQRRRLLLHAVTIAIASLLSILLVLCVVYSFRLSAVRNMLPQWYRFVRNPGTEPDFLVRIYEYTGLYFGYGVAYALGAAVIFVALGIVSNGLTAHRAAVLAGGAGIFFAGFVFVSRRPAQTTFFEVFCLLIFLSATLLAALPTGRLRRYISLAAAGMWLLHACVTFPVGASLAMISSSRAMADERWALFEDTLALAAGRQILVVFPNNEFHHEGVHELLLKASAKFPTWMIDATGKRFLQRFSPRTRYYDEYNRSNIGTAIAESAIVLWFDSTDLAPLEQQYPDLRELMQSPAVKCQRGEYHNVSGEVGHVWWRCVKPS